MEMPLFALGVMVMIGLVMVYKVLSSVLDNYFDKDERKGE